MAHQLIPSAPGAPRVDAKNRLDVLVVRMLDLYFENNFPAVVPVWTTNREMVAKYLASQVGPLQISAEVDGPARAASEALDTLISNRGDFFLRIAWGRYRPLIEQFLKQEFARRGFDVVV